MEENQGAIKMANNSFSSKRTRHVAKHYARDAVDTGRVRIASVEGKKQHADVLTKALEKGSFDRNKTAVIYFV